MPAGSRIVWRMNPNGIDDEYSRMRMQQQIRAEHTGDRAARADHRNFRARLWDRLRQRGGDSAEQVEDKIAAMTHAVFDVVAEDPEIEHVADQMHPAAMHEHRSENGERRRYDLQFRRELLSAEQHGRNDAQRIDRTLTTVTA